jgi:hypothetical protein
MRQPPEIPFSTFGEYAEFVFEAFDPLFKAKPSTELQAVMETAPFQEPKESWEEFAPFADSMVLVLKSLTDFEQWIVDSLVWQRMSLQQVADMLGTHKVEIFRIRNKIFDKIKQVLYLNLTVRERLVMPKSWDESAQQLCVAISDCATAPDMMQTDYLDYSRDWLLEAVDSDSDEAMVAECFTNIAIHAWNELRYRNIADTGKMVHTLCSKQHDYGHDNIKRFGVYGIIVRLSDKIERYRNLLDKGNAVRNESVADTVEDIVGYCVVANMLLDRSFNLELSEEWNNE